MILRKLLINLIKIYHEIEPVFDDVVYKNEPNLDYNKIRTVVATNFPDLGYYNSEDSLGDAIDDLSDIIRDLMEIKWRFQKTSEKDAIWNFCFKMHNHTINHINGLISYIDSDDIYLHEYE